MPWPALRRSYAKMYIGKQNDYTYIGSPPPIGALRGQIVKAWYRTGLAGDPIIYVPGFYTIPGDEVEPFPEWYRNLPSTRPLDLPSAPGGPRPYPTPVRRELPDVIPDWYEVGPRRVRRAKARPDTRPDAYPGRRPGLRPEPGFNPNPAVSPSGEPARAPDEGTGPAEGLAPDPAGEATPARGLIPLESLTLRNAQLEVSAMKKRGQIKGTTHMYERPPSGVKERKAHVSFGKFGKLYGVVTEGRDLVKCFWNALPSSVKRKRKRGSKTIPNMMADIYDNYDKVDLDKAVKCALINEAQDRLIGLSNRLGQKVWHDGLSRGPKSYKPITGPQFGMGYNRGTIGANSVSRARSIF